MKNVVSLAIASENWIIIIALLVLLAITLFIGSTSPSYLVYNEGMLSSIKGTGSGSGSSKP